MAAAAFKLIEKKMINVNMKRYFFLLLLVALCRSVSAEEDAEKVIPPSSQYHDLKPSFVTNFGDPAIVKLKFVKADISLRVFGNEALQVVKDHNALIRHQVVMLLSKQTEETMAVQDGQEKLRQEILQAVNAALIEETGEAQVDDLLFTTFVIQR
jgi:flagellar FliL protein